MRCFFIVIIFILVCSTQSSAALQEKVVRYESDGVSLQGFLVYDDEVSGLRPGILVVHEWWGHNDYARSRARQLAQMGYVAFAVDMYGDGKVASHPDEAGAFVQEVVKNYEVSKKRFLAALDLLKGQKEVDSTQIGAIGYCFGGGTVLNMARFGIDLKGVVSFHGSLPGALEAREGQVKAKILVCSGEDDPMATDEHISAFKREMKDAKVDYQFIEYENAKHSFTNPDADKFAEKFNLPLAYNEQADKASWQDMSDFFNRIFK
jgi:dienelactone hydrolase